jgi:hypothetical protein
MRFNPDAKLDPSMVIDRRRFGRRASPRAEALQRLRESLPQSLDAPTGDIDEAPNRRLRPRYRYMGGQTKAWVLRQPTRNRFL